MFLSVRKVACRTSCLMFCAVFCPAISHATDHISVYDVPTRSGVTVRVLLLKPEKPVATILLFPGGPGRVTFQPDGSTNYRGYPVRDPAHFVRQGFITAVINAPSDRLPNPAMNFFRDTAEHTVDVRHLIAFIRNQSSLPVWLVGHSAGSTSVANAASRLPEGGPDGIVLVSSKNSKPDKASANLDGVDIEKITVPVLVVHHEQDECEWTLFRNATRLMPRLKKAIKSELAPFKGGGPVAGDPCGSLHYHGFPGLEEQVTSRITEWIKSALTR